MESIIDDTDAQNRGPADKEWRAEDVTLVDFTSVVASSVPHGYQVVPDDIVLVRMGNEVVGSARLSVVGGEVVAIIKLNKASAERLDAELGTIRATLDLGGTGTVAATNFDTFAPRYVRRLPGIRLDVGAGGRLVSA